MKKVLIGCGSVFALFLFLGACAAVIGSVAGDKSTEAAKETPKEEPKNETAKAPEPEKKEEKKEEPKPKPKKKAARIGDKVAAGNLAYRIESVEERKQLSNIMGTKKPGSGTFALVRVTVWNNDNEGRAMAEAMTTLVDKEGNKYEPSADAMMYLDDPNENALMDQINPKGKKTYTIVYDISGKASDCKFVGQDGFGFASRGKKAVIELKK